MTKTIRNLIIFAIVAVSGGWAGIALDQLAPPANRMEGLGVLVWLVSPLLAVVVLRAFGGDGWQDFGLKLNLRAGWRWYLVALGIAPLVALVTLGLGFVLGAIRFNNLTVAGLGTLLSLIGVAFASALVKNIFEEFAWRGYLTPRLAALKLHPALGYLLTGFIWAAWHVPYYVYFLDRSILQAHTPLSLEVFIALAFFLLPLHAITYGELRLITQSVWPVWLLHCVANAVSLPLISNGFVTLNGDLGVWLSPGTEGIVATLLFALIGVGLYLYRVKNSPGPQTAGSDLRPKPLAH